LSRTGLLTTDPPQVYQQVAAALRAATPALLFGLRLWIAVCLALYIAFWLQLENPSWAGASAAIVCQPNLGASLRKGWFRMIGTTTGAVAIVVLTACFPQNRLGFLLGLALWGGACGVMVALLRNFASYSAALAGYTAAIIASDELGATRGASGDVFMLAVTRASEICIGIVCAGLVLAGTDFGGTRRRLAVQFAGLAAEITGWLTDTFSFAGRQLSETRPVRRDLVRRLIALDPVIDQALGESSDLRLHASILQTAVGGLIAALSGWRMVAVHLERLPTDQGRREADLVLANIPQQLRSVPTDGGAKSWAIDPSGVRRACTVAARALTALPSRTPSLRLLADQTARALIGIRRTFDALLLLADPTRRILDLRPPVSRTMDERKIM
jgi:Fusaric acid resistance protein family